MSVTTVTKHIGEGFGKGELNKIFDFDTTNGVETKDMRFNTSYKQYFRGTGIYIYSSATDTLDIVATTINITGATATAFTAPVTIDDTLTASIVSALTITTTSASTSGSVVIKPLYVTATMSATGGLGRAIEGILTVSGKLGSYGNAIKGYIDFTGGTGTSGLASAICAEMKMSASATLGTFGVLELELVCPASWVAHNGTGTNSNSFIYAQVSGDTKGEFDDHGFLFNIQGLTSATTHLLYNNTLKMAVGSTTWYLPMSSAQASYTTAYPIVSTYTSAAAIQIGTTGKIQWRDTDLYIYSSTDGQLDIIANTTIDLTAPTVTATVAAGTISGEVHGLAVSMTGTLSSGDSMVGGNFAVTASGTAATWASGIYAKVTQGATKVVNGYVSGAEFEIVTGAISDSLSDFGVLVLNWSNSATSSILNVTHGAYIMLREYSSVQKCPNFLCLNDATLADSDANVILTDTASGRTNNVLLRCRYGTTTFWLMGTTSAPD